MGLTVYVYRSDLGDCTNGGISSRAGSLCLINVEGPSEPSDLAPAALLMPHSPTGKPYARIVPAGPDGEPAPGWWMMGGNYAASSDSRFREAVDATLGHAFYGAIPIHDRQE